MKTHSMRALTAGMAALFVGSMPMGPALADETCNSPYTSRLIKGQEQFLPTRPAPSQRY